MLKAGILLLLKITSSQNKIAALFYKQSVDKKYWKICIIPVASLSFRLEKQIVAKSFNLKPVKSGSSWEL